MQKTTIDLEVAINKAFECKVDLLKSALCYKDEVLPLMEKLRKTADELETKVDGAYWPMPTYMDLLFGIN